jgi:hypothetical protein
MRIMSPLLTVAMVISCAPAAEASATTDAAASNGVERVIDPPLEPD